MPNTCPSLKAQPGNSSLFLRFVTGLNKPSAGIYCTRSGPRGTAKIKHVQLFTGSACHGWSADVLNGGANRLNGSGGPSQPIPPDFIRTLRRISGRPGEVAKKRSNQWANKEVRQGWFVNVLDIWRATRDPVPYQRVSKRSVGKGERPNGELVDTLCAAHTASRRTRSAGRNGRKLRNLSAQEHYASRH